MNMGWHSIIRRELLDGSLAQNEYTWISAPLDLDACLPEKVRLDSRLGSSGADLVS